MRLTVHKTAYWKEAGRERSGKVKLIMPGHVLVQGVDGCNHLVAKNIVYLKKNTQR